MRIELYVGTAVLIRSPCIEKHERITHVSHVFEACVTPSIYSAVLLECEEDGPGLVTVHILPCDPVEVVQGL